MASVAVVGAGPAGLAAAVQLARCGHAVTIYEDGKPGGALRNARLVENYPGFGKGIKGDELASLMVRQARRWDIEILRENVESVKLIKGTFEIHTTDSRERFDGVIVCTGTSPKRAGFGGEKGLENARLIFYEISKMKELRKGSKICVLGGGEAALDYALNLSDKGIAATVLHRSPLCAIKALLDEAKNEERIAFIGSEMKGARKAGSKIGIEWHGGKGTFDALLVAVGREPALPEMDGIGPKTRRFKTAGDARRGRLGQVAMAVGDGVEAALALDREIGGGA
ncbi:MAG: NAD(P)/FAD-dependent oxidoreductase [Euryarchaeota archaeon]|nr:NAD(P)/FAD-dependent oxidoreductase [Euryarchaeota archaeon]